MNKWILLNLSLMPFICGCGSKDGRFTKEQMELIPLAQREGLPAPSGGFALAVRDQTLTADQILTERVTERFRTVAQAQSYNQFRNMVRDTVEQIVVRKVSDVLLYNEAKREVGENVDEMLDSEVEKRVRRFIVSFGGDYARAEQSLKAMGMDWEDYRQHLKRNILSRWYLSSKYPEEKPISYSALMQSYEQMKEEHFSSPATIKIRLIDIQPAKMNVSDPNTDPERAAMELAEKLIRKIDSGADFSELAREYSHGHRAAYGGLWKSVHPESLAKPYNQLARQAERMKAGEVAGPIEADKHIFIMKLEDKQVETVEPFDKVQKQIEARIKIQRRREAMREFSSQLVEQAAVGRLDEFVDFCVRQIYVKYNED